MSEPRKLVDFDQLYAGRFLKAGQLLGKKVTLTISDYDREALIGDDGKAKPKAILSFKETENQHVACKTNGLCIKAMFGKTLSNWIGKRITIFEGIWNGKPCIRIWGSPDITEEMEVEIDLPRRRPFKMTMHKVIKGGGNGVAKTAAYLATATGQGLPPEQDPGHQASLEEGRT